MDLIDKHLNKIIEFLIFVDNNNFIMSNRTFIVIRKILFVTEFVFLPLPDISLILIRFGVCRRGDSR